MTTEYRAGEEDIGIICVPDPDGFVRMRIVRVENGMAVEYLQSIALPPETARNVAFNLTTASFECEGGT